MKHSHSPAWLVNSLDKGKLVKHYISKQMCHRRFTGHKRLKEAYKNNSVIHLITFPFNNRLQVVFNINSLHVQYLTYGADFLFHQVTGTCLQETPQSHHLCCPLPSSKCLFDLQDSTRVRFISLLMSVMILWIIIIQASSSQHGMMGRI